MLILYSNTVSNIPTFLNFCIVHMVSFVAVMSHTTYELPEPLRLLMRACGQTPVPSIFPLFQVNNSVNTATNVAGVTPETVLTLFGESGDKEEPLQSKPSANLSWLKPPTLPQRRALVLVAQYLALLLLEPPIYLHLRALDIKFSYLFVS